MCTYVQFLERSEVLGSPGADVTDMSKPAVMAGIRTMGP